MCAPQLADIEDGIWQTYQDEGVLVYGINNESIQILRDFIEQTGITFPVIMGNPMGYTIYGGLSPFPRDYIIDPEGIVQYAATEFRPTEMSAIIERFLPTGVGDDEDLSGTRVPRGFLLRQNYPNPFNPSTTIRFELDPVKVPVEVNLSIYSLRGKRVRALVSGILDKGSCTIHWDGTDDGGNPVPSGVYIYRLKVGDEHSVRKMLLTR